ncbi:MAG: hypothetical protein HQL96_06640 [Magnetococcales bacterium]|nr:hypothetical protein [Magnetococcales bacterium]
MSEIVSIGTPPVAAGAARNPHDRHGAVVVPFSGGFQNLLEGLATTEVKTVEPVTRDAGRLAQSSNNVEQHHFANRLLLGAAHPSTGSHYLTELARNAYRNMNQAG